MAEPATYKILVVEDEPIIAMFLEVMLNDLGHDVAAVATTIDEALKLADSLDIDVAIIDLTLNGQSAIRVVERLHAKLTPLILASGGRRDDVDSRFSEVVWLQKPYRQIEVGRAIEQALARADAGSTT